MAVAYRSSSTETAAAASQTLTTSNLPASLAQDDIMIAQIAQRSGSAAINAGDEPTGWNLIDLETTASSWTQWLYWKVAGAGEAGPYTWTSTVSSVYMIKISAYSGADTTSPIQAVSANNSGGTGTASINITGISYTAGSVVAVYMGGTTTSLWNQITNYTERYDVSTGNASTNRSLALDTAAQASAGSTGTVATSSAGAPQQCGQLISIAQAGAVVEEPIVPSRPTEYPLYY